MRVPPVSAKQIQDIRTLLERGMPSLESVQQMEKALDRFNRSQLAIVGLHHNRDLARIQEVVHHANSRLLASLGRIEIDTWETHNIARIHATWTRDIQASVDRVSHLRAVASAALSESFKLATVANRFAERLDAGQFRLKSERYAEAIASVRTSMDGLAVRFDRLTMASGTLSDLAALPSFVMPSASRELVTAGHSVVSLLSDDEDSEEEDGLAGVGEETSGAYELLCREHPRLAKMYQGAREALVGGSVDRERHVLSSLREFWNHFLRTLAPDGEVLSWLVGKPEGLLHGGQPTRRARVLYVCREINHGPLSDFLDSDTKALLDYMHLLNRVHALEPGLSDRQLDTVLLRTDSWLTFMMRISGDRHKC